jgi:heterodisulfide reductase subunit B
MTSELRGECAAYRGDEPLDGCYAAPRMLWEGRWIPRCTDYPAWQARFVKARGFEFVQSGHGQREAPPMRMGRLRAANEEMTRDGPVRQSVDEATRAQYRGTVRVRHLLDVLVNDLGLDLIRDYVERPLRRLRVACYYGCLLTRPPKVVAFDDPEHPTALDRLMAAIGAVPVEWPAKTECCGAGLSLTSPDVMRHTAFRVLEMAERAGADCVAVACPLCQSNLDLRQDESARAAVREISLPVFYFTQLLGLALGLEPKSLGLGKLVVSPRAVLEQVGVGS